MLKSILGKAAFAAALAIALGSSAAQAANLYISEFGSATSASGSTTAQVIPQAALTDQRVGISGSSAASAAFNAKTHAVMLVCDEGCSVAFGSSAVTAATTNYLLQQGVPYTFAVAPSTYVAAIANAAGNIPTGGGGGGGGTSSVDEAGFSAGTSTFTPNGGFYQTTATANPLTNGEQGFVQMTAQRALFENLRDSSGNELGIAAAPLQVSLANTGSNATNLNVNIAASAATNISTNEAQINGVTPTMGNGTTGTGTQRVTLSSDSTGQVALAAGSAVIGTIAPAVGATTTTSATVGVSSAQALAGGTRKYLSIQNESASAFIACALAGTAALNTAGSISIPPYSSFTWESSFVPNDAINCIASAASTPATILSF